MSHTYVKSCREDYMKTLVSAVLAVAVLSGCSIINPKGTLGEEGEIWCNERYRESKHWEDPAKNAALKGYMYGLAAALALQAEGPEDQEAQSHYFSQPKRLLTIDRPKRYPSGFEVITFQLKATHPGARDEIIIAFTGSNDRSDWISTNLNPFGRKQYDEALAYTKEILAREVVKGKRVVLSGISLGGGLAIHVLKNPEIEHQIDEVWAINPSPKIYSSVAANGRMKKKTWLVYSDGEILTWGRGPLRHLIVGSGKIEAGDGQTAVFNLIESNRIYAHFRWGIARQMLWVADYELTRTERNAWTEPFAILQDSRFRACQTEREKYAIKPELQPVGDRPDYSRSSISK